MTNERQGVLSLIALLFVYGFTEFIKSGSFVLPFPAFEFISVIYSLLYFKANRHPNIQFREFLVVLMTLALFFSRSYNYLFFMADHEVEKLDNSALFDLIYLVFLAVMLWNVFCQLRQIKQIVWLLPFVVLLTVETLFPAKGFFVLALGLILYRIGRKEKLLENGNSIWIVLCVLELCRTLVL